ncbi:hypothetical protein SeMB42_g00584 [Synchytrium endobioticum]|uniref:FHA domain-containing protein n=1 Tax=Synchytrium endobioticum TaxID=286115 RepID=A0A507D1L9_9FUNG|nr:hypothetical protein SeLEV6574_g03903 [Synchytrium endobioticum]TPX53883.1 hypothetical protein SeMB42_g00584 [Synchytrium endobioticum]
MDPSSSPGDAPSPDPEIPSIAFVALNGAFKGRRVFRLDAPIYLGRQIDNVDGANPMNALRFPAKVVSRQHAIITCRNGKAFIQDTKSSSGTFLNGHRLSAQAQESPLTALYNGDTLKLGEDCDVNGVLHSSIVMKVEIHVASLASPSKSLVEFRNVENVEDIDADFSTDPAVKNHVEVEFRAVLSALLDGIDPPLVRLQAIIDGKLDPTALPDIPAAVASNRLSPSGSSSPQPGRSRG